MRDSQASAPEVAREEVLSDLLDQIIAQRRAGNTVDLHELVGDRHELREELERMLPTLEAMAFGFSDIGNDPGLESAIGQSNREIGDFRIVREIGRGGMGTVYEAQQLSLGRRVALKILPFAAVLDERQRARFKNEAMAAALLEHPHIVPVYSVGCERGVHFYAMRYIEGTTLAEAFRDRHGDVEGSPASVLDRGRPSASFFSHKAHEATNTSRNGVASGSGRDADRFVSSLTRVETEPVAQLSTQIERAAPARWRQLAECGIQAADALEVAHQHGVIHRDVKPSNLLIDARGHLWVTDFGLAQVAGNHELTMSGDLLGTLRYMSPEQATGQTLLDARTDVYSLGATLYELLAGQPVFDAPDRPQLLRCIIEREPPPLRRIVRSIPLDLETVILKSLAKDRDERYPSMAALAADLRRFLAHQPIQAKPPGILRRANKWGRRHRLLIGVGAAGFVAAALMGGSLLWQERNKTAAAWEQERRQRVDAQANLDLALEALENIYAKFLSDHMATRPDLRDLQVELVSDSVRFYSRIALANRTSPAGKPKAARALLLVADLNEQFGDQQVAEDAYGQGRAILQELLARHPNNAEYLNDLATANMSFGYWLRDRGRAADALDVLGEAVAQFDRFRAQFGRPFDFQNQEGASCNYAMALAGSGRLAEAEAAMSQVNTLILAHLERWPEAFDARNELARHLRHMAGWRGKQGDYESARRLLLQGLEEQARAVRQAPQSADLRFEQTLLFRDLAQVHKLLGDDAAEERAREEHRKVLEKLIRDHPAIKVYRDALDQISFARSAPPQPNSPMGEMP